MPVLWLAAVMLALVIAVPARGSADDDLGKKVYSQKCQMCHGADGKGNAALSAKLKVTIPDLAAAAGRTDAELTKLVTEGKKPMPAFAKSLKPEEVQAVVHFAKGFGTAPTAGK
jgi:mono/diheme cytochrome c family protein